jgi:MscS family membrane protein
VSEVIVTVLATLAAALVILLLAWSGGWLIGAFLRRLTRRTSRDYDVGLVTALAPLIGWLIAAIGFALGAAWLGFLSESGRWLFSETAFYLFVFSVADGLRRWVDYSLDHYVATRGDDIDQNVAGELVPLARRVSVLVIIVVVVLIVAGHLELDVVALSAALGLGGFAIALALKDTITNIFSGLVIMISRPFVIGDRVDVPTLDAWGDVTDIGMRSTTFVMRDNRFVVVPNSALVDDTITNYSKPDPSYRLQLDIGLDQEVDMRFAQAAIRDEVRAVEGVLEAKPVDVWFTSFGEYTNVVRVRWWVESFTTWRASTDAVANAIVDVTSREGIGMPDPRLTLGGRLALEPVGEAESADTTSESVET